jgi:hypothetical protein
MERVAFIVEESGARIPCMLNPESVVIRRRAGLMPRQTTQGPLVIADMPNDPLVFTGGGCTELTLNLLFDTTLPSSTPLSDDVRAMTVPLWKASQGISGGSRGSQAPAVRFFWGKWNMLGAISSLAERLEHFTPEGYPRRSWLRLRFLELVERPASATEQPSLGFDEGMPAGAATGADVPLPGPLSMVGEPGDGEVPKVADYVTRARSASRNYLADLLEADTIADSLDGSSWI